jgi:hypothetical protein
LCKAAPVDDPPKGKRTETVVREYDQDGDLVKETTTIITSLAPKQDAQPEPGGYL